MLSTFCAILHPPAPLVRARPAGKQSCRPECDAIPVITMRGRTLAIRPVTPRDTLLLADLLARLSQRSAQLRFFRPPMSREAIWREAERVADGNRRLHAALIATVIEDGALRAVALAELAHDQGDTALAETAIVVRDDYQQEGLGHMLAQFLIRLAMLRGVATLRVDMLAQNQATIKLVHRLGLSYTAQTHRGETTALLELPQELDADGRA